MKKLIALFLTVILIFSSMGALADIYSDRDTVSKVQQALNDAGYDCGTPDGMAGNKTYAAIESFYRDKGYAGSIAIDDALLERLGLVAGSSSVPRAFVNSFNADFVGTLNGTYSDVLKNAGMVPEDVMNVVGLGIPYITSDSNGRSIVQSSSQWTRLEMKGDLSGGDLESVESVSLTFLDMGKQVLENFWLPVSLNIFLNQCDEAFGATRYLRRHAGDIIDLVPYDEARDGWPTDQFYKENEETVVIDSEDYRVTYKAALPEITFTVYPPEPAKIKIRTVDGADTSTGLAEVRLTDSSYVTTEEMLKRPEFIVSTFDGEMKTEFENIQTHLDKAGLTVDDLLKIYELAEPEITTDADGTSHAQSANTAIRFDMSGEAQDGDFERVDSVSLTFLNRVNQNLDVGRYLSLRSFLTVCDYLYEGRILYGVAYENTTRYQVMKLLVESETSPGLFITKKWYTPSKETLMAQTWVYYVTYKYDRSSGEMTFTVYPGQKPDTSDIVEPSQESPAETKAPAAEDQGLSDERFAAAKETMKQPLQLVSALNDSIKNNLNDCEDQIRAMGLTKVSVTLASKLGIPRYTTNDDGTTTMECTSQKARLELMGIYDKETGFERVDKASMTLLNMKAQSLDIIAYSNLKGFFWLIEVFFIKDKADRHAEEVLSKFVSDENSYLTEKWYAEGEETMIIQTANYYVTYQASIEDSGEITFTIYPGQKP